MQKMSKRGNMALGSAAVIGFVVMVLIAVIGAQVTQGVRDSTTAGTAARNVSDFGLQGFQNFGSLLGVTGTVIIAAVLIALVGGAFYFAGRQ